MKRNMKIKSHTPIILLLLAAIFSGTLFQACQKNNDETATPVVNYIRITDPDKSDSLVTSAFMGSTIAIMGENLQDVNQVWFNDQQAFVNSSFVTGTSLIITIPDNIPGVVTNLMYILTTNTLDTLKIPFKVNVPAPKVDAMYEEYIPDGGTAIILGNFFIDDPSSPLKVFFPGNIEGVVQSVTLNEIYVTVPDGAGIGPIQVKSIYGTTRSNFYFRDDRGIFLNYDNLTTGGSWRGGTIKNDDFSLDNNYLMLKGTLGDNAGGEDFSGGGFVSELWSDANGRPEGNLFTGSPEDYLFKFEANVIAWTGAYLNICWGPWASSVGPYQNQLYWSDINARGLWRPWETAGATSFKTNGWMTVTIPMTEMKYNKDFDAMEFDPALAGSLTFWMKGPSATSGADSEIEIYIDNVRIVHK